MFVVINFRFGLIKVSNALQKSRMALVRIGASIVSKILWNGNSSSVIGDNNKVFEMGKIYKKKLRSCSLCKPHKMKWADKKKPQERQGQTLFEKAVRERNFE